MAAWRDFFFFFVILPSVLLSSVVLQKAHLRKELYSGFFPNLSSYLLLPQKQIWFHLFYIFVFSEKLYLNAEV